jgi:precorrin-6Y C5,15-methyltransferase (decarboxylating)
MAKVLTVLTPDGVIVFNSVNSPVVTQMTDRKSSRQLWDEACNELHLCQANSLRIQVNDYNPIEIFSASF